MTGWMIAAVLGVLLLVIFEVQDYYYLKRMRAKFARIEEIRMSIDGRLAACKTSAEYDAEILKIDQELEEAIK